MRDDTLNFDTFKSHQQYYNIMVRDSCFIERRKVVLWKDISNYKHQFSLSNFEFTLISMHAVTRNIFKILNQYENRDKI